MKTASIIAAAKLAATGVVLASGMAQAAEIKVLSSAAFREAYLELVPAFERATEHKVATTWAGTNGIMERMKRGETTDIVIMSAQGIDQLVQDGKIVAGSRIDVARSGVGVAVRSGLPKPDIGSTEALKRALAPSRSPIRPARAGSIWRLCSSASESRTRSSPSSRWRRAARRSAR